MPSTFFGLTIASSGLTAYQAALNTTANNISNVRTEGYSRQQANRVASAAIRTYTAYGSMGTGVTTTSIKQVRNEYYDTKYWYNQSYTGLYEKRLDYLEQIENNFIDDDTSEGFSTILNEMFNALDTLKNNAADLNNRQQFIGSAQNLATYFNSVSSSLSEIQANANEEIKAEVQNINAIAQKISILNKQINIIELQGGYANELRDQRAVLVDELSAMVPIEVQESQVLNSNYPDMYTGGTYYTIKIQGEVLVDSFDYYTLECVARKDRINQSDIDGLYDIKWTDTGNTFQAGASSMTGTLKALFDIRDGNNGDNFKGIAEVINNNQIRIKNPSIDSIEALTIPETGVLTINGREIRYDGFTYETDADGKITSYTFDLREAMTNEERARVDGNRAYIGASVDSMGVPYYMAQMNEFLRSFCSKFNEILQKGEDLNGDKTDYYAFFTGNNTVTGEQYLFNGADIADPNVTTTGSNADSYYKLTASNICIAQLCVKSPDLLGATAYRQVDVDGTMTDVEDGVDAYDLLEELALLKEDTILYRGGNAAGFLKCMISDISVDTQESRIFYQNYTNISNTIENQRMSISGVDEDEEALDLVKFQNAYNLSSKMISVMAEIYDRLILETGV